MVPKFFQPGHYEMQAEDEADLLDWPQGVKNTVFAHLDANEEH